MRNFIIIKINNHYLFTLFISIRNHVKNKSEITPKTSQQSHQKPSQKTRQKHVKHDKYSHII